MNLFRQKVGEETLARLGGGLPMSEKSLGETIGQASSAVNPSEEDGDGDGFRTGRDGKDNIPVTKPVKDAIKEIWSDKKQKALEADEKRIIAVAKRFKDRKPTQSVRDINRLLVSARMREDIVDARKDARKWAKSIFEMDGLGENGEYKVRLYKGNTGVNIVGRKRDMPAVTEKMEEPYPHIRISGEILDKDNNPVGFFERHIYLDANNTKNKPHVTHEILRIKDEYKGKGIGSDFTLATELMYSKMGIDSIHLNAGLSDGGYTWLRAGYGFKDDKQRVKLAKQIEQRYQEMLKDAGSKEKLVAGGFMTAVGRHFGDSSNVGEATKMPEPFLESMEELDKFLKILGQLKKYEFDSPEAVPPASLTLFGDFSKRILRATNFDVTKPVRSFPDGQKSIKIYGFDKLFTRV
jgi:hypothetical protein